MKLLQNLEKKKNRKGGFTLVELIVVLVILAILAALLVPALTGYIDKSKQKRVIAETRALLTAIQTETSELYAVTDFPKISDSMSATVIASKSTSLAASLTMLPSTDVTDNYARIVALSELPSLQSGGKGHFCCAVDSSGKVGTLIYDTGDGYTGLYFSESSEYLAIPSSESITSSFLSNTYSDKVVIAITYYEDSSYPGQNMSYWGKFLVLTTIERTDLL